MSNQKRYVVSKQPDLDSRLAYPRPRLQGFKTKTCKNGSRDVSRPRLKSRELQVCKQLTWLSLPTGYRAPSLQHTSYLESVYTMAHIIVAIPKPRNSIFYGFWHIVYIDTNKLPLCLHTLSHNIITEFSLLGLLFEPL